MSLIHDEEMCVVCETRNCQHRNHHVLPWEANESSEEISLP